LEDAGHKVDPTKQNALRRALKAMDRFRRGLIEAYPWPAHLAASLDDDIVVCRCENITVGELRDAVDAKGGVEVNRAKAFSRVGMGRCQGRYCGQAAAEIIAAASGLPLEEVGRLRGQAPIKPFPIAAQADGEASP
jgi:NAD(P)H-nitrite reductase large subunit